MSITKIVNKVADMIYTAKSCPNSNEYKDYIYFRYPDHRDMWECSVPVYLSVRTSAGYLYVNVVISDFKTSANSFVDCSFNRGIPESVSSMSGLLDFAFEIVKVLSDLALEAVAKRRDILDKPSVTSTTDNSINNYVIKVGDGRGVNGDGKQLYVMEDKLQLSDMGAYALVITNELKNALVCRSLKNVYMVFKLLSKEIKEKMCTRGEKPIDLCICKLNDDGTVEDTCIKTIPDEAK